MKKENYHSYISSDNLIYKKSRDDLSTTISIQYINVYRVYVVHYSITVQWQGSGSGYEDDSEDIWS